MLENDFRLDKGTRLEPGCIKIFFNVVQIQVVPAFKPAFYKISANTICPDWSQAIIGRGLPVSSRHTNCWDRQTVVITVIIKVKNAQCGDSDEVGSNFLGFEALETTEIFRN